MEKVALLLVSAIIAFVSCKGRSPSFLQLEVNVQDELTFSG